MANTLFSCLSCNTLYATFYEIEAHLLHDPCHDHDNQELYDTYGTSEYLHVMVTKINVLINMPEQVEGNADQVEDKRESKEEEEERQWEEKLFQQLCMGIQDDEDSGLREDQVVSLSPIRRLGILPR